MPEKDYSATKLVVFTQQCESGLKNRFDDLYDQLVAFADQNNKTKPKKQDLLKKLFSATLPSFKVEDFFE